MHDEVLSKIDATLFNQETYDKVKLFESLGLKDLHAKIIDPTNGVLYFNKTSGFIEINETLFEEIEVSENLPDILLIDEITYFGPHELFLLNKLAEKAKLAGKTMKIIGAGDISQSGYEFEGISANVDSVSGIFTPRLSLTVRALNSQQRKNIDTVSAIAKFTRQN
ncbi:MAG: hypothetical protein ACOH2V_01190 [Candidatus Saccharimonadaceae bacterium]